MTDAAEKSHLTSLISAVESSLADMVSALGSSGVVDRIQGVERLLSAIEAGIADIAAAADKKIDLDPLISAIKAVKPTIKVNVPPISVSVPATVVNVAAADNKGATWKVSIPDADGGPARTMTITRTA